MKKIVFLLIVFCFQNSFASEVCDADLSSAEKLKCFKEKFDEQEAIKDQAKESCLEELQKNTRVKAAQTVLGKSYDIEIVGSQGVEMLAIHKTAGDICELGRVPVFTDDENSAEKIFFPTKEPHDIETASGIHEDIRNTGQKRNFDFQNLRWFQCYSQKEDGTVEPWELTLEDTESIVGFYDPKKCD